MTNSGNCSTSNSSKTFFTIGFSRSGTTLLAGLLNSHSLITYEFDNIEAIAAECGRDSHATPPDIDKERTIHSRNSRDNLVSCFLKHKAWFERKAIDNPFKILGSNLVTDTPPLTKPQSKNVFNVGYMTGFRMPCRTEPILGGRFDQNLKEYGPHEDIDTSFTAWKQGCVVANTDALFYHHKSPEQKRARLTIGVTVVLNIAYIFHKPSKDRETTHRLLVKLTRSNHLLCIVQCKSKFMRMKRRGIKSALPLLKNFKTAPQQELSQHYQSAFGQLLRPS